MTTVVLDNEAVEALRDPTSNKHRRVLAIVAAGSHARRRRPAIRLVVPPSVRVESGWDRTDPAAATVNRLGIADHTLDTSAGGAVSGLSVLRI